MNLTATMNLETLNRADLYQLATHARINRRSTMNKAQLIAAIEALAEYNPDMYSAVELHYGVHIAADDTTPEPEAAPEAPADTATPERIALVHALADHDGSDSGIYSDLCDTFRREGMGNLDADTAAWALWVRYLHGEFPRETAPAPAPEAEEVPEYTATPERIALAVQVAAKRTGAYTKLCASFRTDGMNDRNAHAAAWHLRGRAVGGEFITVTLPGALRDILADTDALDGLHTAPGGARGSLRVTGTAAQLTDLTYDRLWVCAYNSSSEVHERAAYRRWLLALEDAGITL
jgi:hypothetical protein